MQGPLCQPLPWLQRECIQQPQLDPLHAASSRAAFTTAARSRLPRTATGRKFPQEVCSSGQNYQTSCSCHLLSTAHGSWWASLFLAHVPVHLLLADKVCSIWWLADLSFRVVFAPVCCHPSPPAAAEFI